MRIERIILRNYRQFRESMISFNKRPDVDLHFFIGKNGTGKTNLLNALNWCLYNEEPHLSKDSHGLPILNLKTIERTDIGKEREVVVEVWAETEQETQLTFRRRAVYRKQDRNKVTRLRTDFEVKYQDERGNTKIVSDDDALSWVERFVPNNIREFFFFDGERLDNYFKEATSQNIRHAVFQISQIDLLETRVEHRLQETLGDLRKEAGKASPKIEEARTKLEEAQSKLAEIDDRIGECERQIAISRTKIAEYEEKLKGVPDIEALEDERQQLLENSAEAKGILKSKEEARKNLLVESGSILMLWPAVEQATQVIAEKRRKNEIPPPVDKGVLEEVIRNKICVICGNKLDDRSEKRVRKLIEEVELSSETARRLTQMESPLYHFRKKAQEFDEKVKAITNEIDGSKKILSRFTEEINRIDSQMSGYDEALVREWYSQRAKFESIRDLNQQNLGGLKEVRQDKEDAVNEFREELAAELKKEKKVRDLTKKVAFCERALNVVGATRKTIMKETRESIERETKKQFFKLVWKRATFGDVRINDDYSIGLIHAMGYDALGSVSAGERELLALSFTLALHHVSGFDSPILIDTPVARISDVNRENFAKVLLEVSTTKQIILLFTPDEYSDEISKFLHGRATGRYNISLSSDEIDAKVKEL